MFGIYTIYIILIYIMEVYNIIRSRFKHHGQNQPLSIIGG